jgi:hypothetical protein
MKIRPFARIIVVAIAGMVLASCASATQTPSASPTANPAEVNALIAVGEKAIPFYPTLNSCPGCPKSNVYADCAWAAGTWGYSLCPISPRLKAYLQQPGHMRALCRVCTQGSPTRTMTAEPTPTGGIVHVSLYAGLLRLDLIVVKVNGQQLVDDSVCTGGGPETSIYNPPPDAPSPNAWTCGFGG